MSEEKLRSKDVILQYGESLLSGQNKTNKNRIQFVRQEMKNVNSELNFIDQKLSSVNENSFI